MAIRTRSWLLAFAVAVAPYAVAAQSATTPPLRITEVKPVYTEQAMRARIPAPPPSAWPASFADDISDPGATWKPDSVKLGDTTLHFESPAGWIVRNFPDRNILLGLISGDGRRVLMTGPAMKMPGPLRLPLTSDGVDAFGKRMASLPPFQKTPLQASGQVQIGKQWWMWLEFTPGPGMLGQMPAELRDGLASHHFSEMKVWAFVTGQDNELVQVLVYDWLPDAGPDRDAELRGATSTFRVILEKMSLSK